MKRLIHYTLLLCLAISLAGTTKDIPPPRQVQDRALFFAVSEYAHSSLTNLPQPLQNAQAIAGILEERYGFETEVVPNPTLAQIRQKLYDYRTQYDNGVLDAQGQLLIFFSGHGVKAFGQGYFLPADAQAEDVFSTGLAYDQWRNFINEINCAHILVAVDACYSVTFDPNWQSKGDNDPDRFRRKNELSESDRILANYEQHPSRLFFTSDAKEDVTPGRSNFARKMLDGLANHRSMAPFLSAKELFASYISKAQPTPNVGDFGKDDPRSSFLFFPKARVNLGDTRADGAAYRIAKATGTLAAYRQYLRDYPTGDFKTIVQKEIDRLEAEDRELLAWERAKQQNTRTAYETFIRDYPNSIFVAVAQQNLREPSPSLVREGRVLDADRSVSGGSTSGSPDNFIRIPGGTFQMGDQFNKGSSNEKPVHTVQLSTFYLSPTEVTFAEYDAFYTATGRDKPDDEGWGRGQRPAINVSWYDAIEYANWLSQRNNLRPYYQIGKNSKDSNNTNNDDDLKWIVSINSGANGYRLPTEAEWEYAAREGGRKVRFGNGEDILRPDEANFNASSDYKKSYSKAGIYRRKTIAVGSLNHPNSLGLHDMTGNVWEWCWDWYDSSYYNTSPRNDPSGAAKGSYRVVLRGGSWIDSPRLCRAANRNDDYPTFRYGNIGFRLARGS